MLLHDNLFAKPEQIQLVCCRALVHRCFEVGCLCTGDTSESRVLSLLLPTESERDRFKYIQSARCAEQRKQGTGCRGKQSAVKVMPLTCRQVHVRCSCQVKTARFMLVYFHVECSRFLSVHST